jgi:type III secretion protein S
MHEALILDYTVKAMMLVLLLSLPPILVATIVGMAVSLLQALTQIQEQTLGFAVKLIAVTATLLLSAHFIGGELFNFANNLFENFALMAR